MKVASVTLTLQEMATMLREAVRAKIGCEPESILVATKPADPAMPHATLVSISKTTIYGGMVPTVHVHLFPNAGASSQSWEE